MNSSATHMMCTVGEYNGDNSVSPLVSVIVVTYNQEDTLARTLDSILSQNVDFRVEIVVSDDASSDGTPSVLEAYAKKYPGVIIPILRDKNVGVQRNYFEALERCRGRYIADCAGDDYWLVDDKLTEQVKCFEEDDNLVLVHTGWKFGYPDGRMETFRPSMPRASFAVEGSETASRLLMGRDAPAVHLCSAMYSKEAALSALNANRDLFLDPKYKCEDLQLAYEVCRRGNVRYISRATLCYSVGHPSISSDEDFGKTFDFYYGTFQLRLALARKDGVDDSKTLGKFSKTADFLTAQAFRDGDPRRRDMIESLVADNNLRASWKSRMYKFFMSNSLLWKMMRGIRGLFK